MTKRGVTLLLEALNEIADDCESVARDKTLTDGERRAWRAMATKARVAIRKAG